MTLRVGEWTEIVSVTGGQDPLKVLESPTGTSLVLMDGEKPLFAVRVTSMTIPGSHAGAASHPPCDGNLVARADGVFQHVFAKDKQRFGFRVTNFSDEHAVFTIRRKYGAADVNKVNCVNPRSEATVVSDYSNDERWMELHALHEGGGGVTVAKDEEEGLDDASGTYFAICVYPTREGSDWTTAGWRPEDYVVSHRREMRASFGGGGGWGAPAPIYEPAFAVVPRSFGSPSSPAYSPASSPVVQSGGGWGAPAPAPGFKPAFAGVTDMSFGSPPSPAFSPVAQSGGRGSPPSPVYGAAFGAPSAEQQAAFTGAALAAKVSHGERQETRTRSVDLEPRYDKGSASAILCLSLLAPDNVLIFPRLSREERVASAIQRAAEYYQHSLVTVADKAPPVIEQKRFEPEEECVVCMDAEPGCVFAQCGHSAVCTACAPKLSPKKCPMCRGTIHACIIVPKQ